MNRRQRTITAAVVILAFVGCSKTVVSPPAPPPSPAWNAQTYWLCSAVNALSSSPRPTTTAMDSALLLVSTRETMLVNSDGNTPGSLLTDAVTFAKDYGTGPDPLTNTGALYSATQIDLPKLVKDCGGVASSN